MSGPNASRARLIGFNHVALDVGSVTEALDFYSDVFEFDVRGRTDTAAFVDMGDQFLALSESDRLAENPEERTNVNAGENGAERSAEDGGAVVDDHRHVGFVVDDPTVVESRLEALGVDRLPTDGLDFRDPWGNRIQVVAYGEVQFTKAAHVLDGMGLSDLEKAESAIEELAEKGMAPE